jgi:hypothetical protein
MRLLSLTRAKSRVVTGLLTGHNTLRRHLHLMGLIDSPPCRKCSAEEETSAHILCQCEALASIRQAHLGSFFLEPEDIKSQTLGAIWCFSKAAGLPWKTDGAQRAGIRGLGALGLRALNPYTNQSKSYTCMSTSWLLGNVYMAKSCKGEKWVPSALKLGLVS